MRKLLKRILIKTKYRVTFGKGCDVSIKSVFEGGNKIGDHTYFNGYLGYGSYIGSHAVVHGKIGRFSSIAGRVVIVNGFHPVRKSVSTYPGFFSTVHPSAKIFVTRNKFEQYRYADSHHKYPVIIGNDVWIGYGVVILAGITIGDGAVIAAGAVVVKDVEPYTVAAGNPAKVTGRRFDPYVTDKLLRMRWWNKPAAWIRRNADYFDDISRFLAADKAGGEWDEHTEKSV